MACLALAIPTPGIEGVFAVKIYLAFAGSGNLDLCDLAKVARMLISYKYDQKKLEGGGTCGYISLHGSWKFHKGNP